MEGIQEMLSKAQAYDKLIADDVPKKAGIYDQMVEVGLNDMIKKAEAYEELQKTHEWLDDLDIGYHDSAEDYVHHMESQLTEMQRIHVTLLAQEVPAVSPEELVSSSSEEEPAVPKVKVAPLQEDKGGTWSEVIRKKCAVPPSRAKSEGVDVDRPISKDIMLSTLMRYCMARHGQKGPDGHTVRCMDVADQLGWKLPAFVTSPLSHNPDYNHPSKDEIPEHVSMWSPEHGRWVEKYGTRSPIYKTGICMRFFGDRGCCFSAAECANCHREDELKPYVRYMG
jgi:hypothetical protein